MYSKWCAQTERGGAWMTTFSEMSLSIPSRISRGQYCTPNTAQRLQLKPFVDLCGAQLKNPSEPE